MGRVIGINKTVDQHAARRKRGFTSEQLVAQYSSSSDEELIVMCGGADAQKRTAAAKLLGARKCGKAVQILCEQLKNESALYSRIAASEALGAIGERAIAGLVALLGRVGRNQHRELPQKGFYKKSYPLPRDMAARTITKIGAQALPALEKIILGGDKIRALEAIDGVGHIAFYCHDLRSESVLLAAFDRYLSDDLVKWKIVRALQSFPSQQVQQLLMNLIRENCIPQLRWEAVRSLGQTGCGIPAEVLNHAERDAHVEVRAMAKVFLVGHKK